MNLDLTGKRALVTGSSQGIGTGIAAVLSREGATVVVHGRNQERTEKVAASIRSDGGKAYVAVGDLATDAGASDVAKAALDHAGGIDILVNNAGGPSAMRDWLETPLQDWNTVLQGNLLSSVRLARVLAPGMRERHWGRIVNIASIGGVLAMAQSPDYGAAKAGVINMTVSLAKALKKTGITVNAISPGIIRTVPFDQMLDGIAGQMGWPADYETREKNFLQQMWPLAADHVGTPEDVGNLVAFLASPLAGYITGGNFRIDGGQFQTPM